LAGFLLASCQEKPAPATPPNPAPPPPPPVSYTFEIRPILAQKCFSCHGPDDLNNESGLRLDSAEFAFHPLGDDHQSDLHAWVPGDRDRSVAWQRLHSDDLDQRMPPPGQAETLTGTEMELIGRWIDQGANYEPHWAFQPLPTTVPVPRAPDPAAGLTKPPGPDGWPVNNLDRFVLARLQREGLLPAPEADGLTLLRRVSLALTGLPPTPEELDSFRTSALSATVDRLLSSPAFGEHLASLWLKTARYADTLGPESEHHANRWPYRDWVAKAFNDNLPYDQFLTAQLAGDLDSTIPAAFSPPPSIASILSMAKRIRTPPGPAATMPRPASGISATPCSASRWVAPSVTTTSSIPSSGTTSSHLRPSLTTSL
ncbi:MAG: DUF1549 domain-containing protein, partial [Akkermansiaceae bacterium]|nr:DUF1549 domain-containing protein [Akkermansiaceae bacterium]